MPGLKTRSPSDPEPRPDAWVDAVIARQTAAFTMPEFLKALRALSARYVESRGRLPDRSPIDSAGKRAAFAAFYAPLHFLTARQVARALDAGRHATDTIVDLGCGTGVASAAWALARQKTPSIRGVDQHPWVLPEAQWNWRQLGLAGTARRGDLLHVAEELASARNAGDAPDRTTVILGWSVNELDRAARARLLTALVHLATRGVRVVVIEPIARSVSPWWDDWVAALSRLDGRTRADDWKFDEPLPPSLERMNDAAGFSARALSARTIVTGVTADGAAGITGVTG